MTHKQQRFVSAYVGEAKFNAAKAAEIAGYRSPKQAGYELKHEPEIAAAIQAHLDEAAMTADEVLTRLADQARGIGDYLSYEVFDSALGPVRVMNLDWARLKADGMLHLVAGWEYDKGGRLQVKFTDSQIALLNMGRHHKLFTDKVEQHDPETDAKIDQLLAELESAREAEVAGEAGGEDQE